MARRSSHEHLKGEVFDWFGSGLKPSEVREKYPAIAKTTIYDWHKEWRSLDYSSSNSGILGTNSVSDSGMAATPVSVEIVSDNVQLAIPHIISGTNKKRSISALPTKHSDYWRVRREAVSIATDPTVAKYVQVQAIAATCKLLELERDLPKHILEQQSETTIENSRDRIRDQPLNEIAKEYREAMR